MKKVLLLCISMAFVSYNLFAQKPTPGNVYKIKNAKSGLFLANAGAQNKGAVIIMKPQVQNGGHWFVEKGQNGFRFKNVNSGMYMASFGATKPGSEIKQTNSPGPGAFWRVVPPGNGSQSKFRIRNDASKMNVASMGGSNGDAAKLNDKGGEGAFWTFIPVN